MICYSGRNGLRHTHYLYTRSSVNKVDIETKRKLGYQRPIFSNVFLKAGEVTNQLRALATLSEDQSLIHITDADSWQCPVTIALGESIFFWPPQRPDIHVAHIHTCRKLFTQRHKIKEVNLQNAIVLLEGSVMFLAHCEGRWHAFLF